MEFVENKFLKQLKKEVTKSTLGDFPGKQEWRPYKRHIGWVFELAGVNSFMEKDKDKYERQELKTEAEAKEFVTKVMSDVGINMFLVVLVCSVLPLDIQKQIQMLPAWSRD